jgi:hypothetical protein
VTDLGGRIRGALERLPAPTPERTERARRAAQDALAANAPRRPRRGWVAAGAAAAAAVLLAGVALASTDRLEVRVGKEVEERPPVAESTSDPRVELPAGVRGLALVQRGRLWLATTAGLGVQGLAVSTAELSPQALYLAVGLGRSLVAMAPDGRRAWSHETAGPVVAIAWAPNPIVIAYVVRRGARHELRVIEGDGDNDRLVDRDVAAVQPSWRADTGALAYADGDRRLAIADYPSLSPRAALATPRGLSAVAYAPSGDRIAVASGGADGSLAVGTAEGLRWSSLAPRTIFTDLAWRTTGELVAAGRRIGAGGGGRLWTLPVGDALGKPSAAAHGPVVEALSPLGSGRLAVAVRTSGGVAVWEIASPAPGRETELQPEHVVLRIPATGGGVQALASR